MPDYASNSKRSKEEAAKPAKKVESVVQGEVIIKKKPIGRKIKDLFIEADFRTVMRYIAYDVMIPAARNMIVDASSKGIERLMYGESAMRRRHIGGPGPRITYNNPINRDYRNVSTARYAPQPAIGPRSQAPSREEFVLSSREEGELVLERMGDLIDQYEVASVADFKDLVGLASSHVDNKWGWTNLADVAVRQIREGYLIDLPPAEPIE